MALTIGLIVVLTLMTAYNAIEYLSNKHAVDMYNEAINNLLTENKDGFVDNISSAVVSAILPRVNIGKVEHSLTTYLLDKRQDDLMRMIAELVSERMEVTVQHDNTESES